MEKGDSQEQPQQQLPAVDEIEKFPELRKDQVDGVFIDFSPEGALNKLITLSKSPFNERLTYTKHLDELILLIGEAAQQHLNDIITFLVNDNDDIKRALLLQLPHVIDNMKNQPSGYEQIRDILTPALFLLIANENLDIKEDSGKILAQIGDIMNKEDRGKYILTKVLNMAHDDLVDDNRIVAIQLLTQMAHCFGPELCQQFVGLEILSLGEDPQLRVRKESVLNLPTIGKVVSEEFFQQRLLPFYIKKSQDPFWGIRKACVDTIVEISTFCPAKIKETELTELLVNCLKDQSKWVKMAAYKNLGPFIVTLNKCHASEKLFDHYIKMTDPTVNSLSNENEILVVCSQYFPAILEVYGEKKWPQLQKTFLLLIKSNLKKVKKPIACGLHEIARILGQEKAEKDLFNILDSILKDPNDEVKYGAISHLAEFMEIFDSQKRENFLDVFLILQKDPKKWRIRELIARQIDLLAKMFNPETVFRYIMPISFKLCNDTVSIVREQAAKKVHSILLELIKEPECSDIYLSCVVDNIRAFSVSTRFNQRQTFILMSNQLMMYPDIFKKSFVDTFETLSKDKVVNVRISLAHAISSHIQQKGPLSEDPAIQKIVEVLKQDKSRDVRSYFVQVEDYLKSKGATSITQNSSPLSNNTQPQKPVQLQQITQKQPESPGSPKAEEEEEETSQTQNPFLTQQSKGEVEQQESVKEVATEATQNLAAIIETAQESNDNQTSSNETKKEEKNEDSSSQEKEESKEIISAEEAKAESLSSNDQTQKQGNHDTVDSLNQEVPADQQSSETKEDTNDITSDDNAEKEQEKQL